MVTPSQTTSSSCAKHPLLAAYLTFAQKHTSQSHAPAAEIVKTIQSNERTRRWTCPGTFSHLRRWLLEATRLTPLLVELGGTRLVLRLEPKRPTSNRRRFALKIPALGVVTGLIAWPKQPSRHPAVLLLHGHYGSASAAYETQGGDALVRAGFIVMAPENRSYQASAQGSTCEPWLAEHLWTRSALPLASLQTLEALAALTALRALREVDPSRVAIVAHSGGIQAALLAAIIDPKVRGLSLNEPFMTEGLWPCKPQDTCRARLHCATIPGARESLAPTLRREGALPFPTHRRPHQKLSRADQATLVSFFTQVTTD